MTRSYQDTWKSSRRSTLRNTTGRTRLYSHCQCGPGSGLGGEMPAICGTVGTRQRPMQPLRGGTLDVLSKFCPFTLKSVDSIQFLLCSYLASHSCVSQSGLKKTRIRELGCDGRIIGHGSFCLVSTFFVSFWLVSDRSCCRSSSRACTLSSLTWLCKTAFNTYHLPGNTGIHVCSLHSTPGSRSLRIPSTCRLILYLQAISYSWRTVVSMFLGKCL